MKNNRTDSRRDGSPSGLRFFYASGGGAYGMIPADMAPTCREEGVFVSPTHGVWRRFLYVSSLIEEIAWNEGAITVAGPFSRQGVSIPHFTEPELAEGYPYPEAVHRGEGFRLKRTFFPVDGERSIVLRYRIAVKRAGVFRVRPVFGFRPIHELSGEREIPLGIRKERSGVFFRYGAAPIPPLVVASPGAEFADDFRWIRGIWFSADEGRGVEFIEDLPSPGYLTFPLEEGANTLYLMFSIEEKWEKFIQEKPARVLRKIREALKGGRPLTRDLPRLFQKDFNPVKECALRMIFDVEGGATGYSGLPRYGVNVYDLVSSLNDFFVEAGLVYQTSSVLKFTQKYLKKGLLPKYLDESGVPVYSSADTSLLLVDALGRYMTTVTSMSEVERLYALVKEIVYSYLDGTDCSIRVDTDYLVTAGEEGIEATWMDRVRGDIHLTPRHGKAVDVNALWYSALCVLRDLALSCGDKKVVQEMVRLIPRVKNSFLKTFVLDREGYLADVVRGDKRIVEIRPNQLFALAAKYPVIASTFGRRVLQRVKEQLLTDYGLRTLAPDDPSYRGRIEGDEVREMEAIFNGAVLPRLSVVHSRALIAVHGHSTRVRNQMKRYLVALRNLADLTAPFYLPEALDGDPPHAPGGALVSLPSTAALAGLFNLYRSGTVD